MAERGENPNSVASKLKDSGRAIAQATIQRIAAGEIKNPRGDTLANLAWFFHVSVDELRSETKKTKKTPVFLNEQQKRMLSFLSRVDVASQDAFLNALENMVSRKSKNFQEPDNFSESRKKTRSAKEKSEER
jgi:Mn-containing catalase